MLRKMFTYLPDLLDDIEKYFSKFTWPVKRMPKQITLVWRPLLRKNIQQVKMLCRTKRRLVGALLHLRTVFATGGFPTKIVKILCNLEKNTHIYLNWTTTWPCQKILNGCLFVCRIKEWLADFLFWFIDLGSNAFFFRAIFCQTML